MNTTRFIIAALFLLSIGLLIYEWKRPSTQQVPEISFGPSISSGDVNMILPKLHQPHISNAAWIDMAMGIWPQRDTDGAVYTFVVQPGECLRIEACPGDYIINGDARTTAIEFCTEGETVVLSPAALEDGWMVYYGEKWAI